MKTLGFLRFFSVLAVLIFGANFSAHADSDCELVYHCPEEDIQRTCSLNNTCDIQTVSDVCYDNGDLPFGYIDAWNVFNGDVAYGVGDTMTCDKDWPSKLDFYPQKECMQVVFKVAPGQLPNNNSNPTLYKQVDDTKWYTEGKCSVEWNSTYSPLHVPVYSNYIFSGYYRQNVAGHDQIFDNTATISNTWSITEDDIVNGHPQLNAEYTECLTVSFDDHTNGGVATNENVHLYKLAGNTSDLYTDANCSTVWTGALSTPQHSSDNTQVFAGYYTTANGGVQVIKNDGTKTSNSWSANTDPTLYAQFTNGTTSVTYYCYDEQNNTATDNNVTFNSSYDVLSPATVKCGQRPYYFFDGWDFSGNNEIYCTGNNTGGTDGCGTINSWTYSGTQTFKARWKRNVNYECGTVMVAGQSETVSGGATDVAIYKKQYDVKSLDWMTVPGVGTICRPPYDGYVFAGWNFNDGNNSVYTCGAGQSGEYQCGQINSWEYIQANTPTFTATWTAGTYDVKYVSEQSGCTGMFTDSNGATMGAQYTVLNNWNDSHNTGTRPKFACPGRSFEGWSFNGTTPETDYTNCSVGANGDCGSIDPWVWSDNNGVFTAIWSGAQCEFTVNCNNPNTSPNPITLADGSALTLNVSGETGTYAYTPSGNSTQTSGSCSYTNYVFNGWSNGNGAAFFSDQPECDDGTAQQFDAHWCEKCWQDSTGTCTLDATTAGTCTYSVSCADGYVQVESSLVNSYIQDAPRCKPAIRVHLNDDDNNYATVVYDGTTYTQDFNIGYRPTVPDMPLEFNSATRAPQYVFDKWCKGDANGPGSDCYALDAVTYSINELSDDQPKHLWAIWKCAAGAYANPDGTCSLCPNGYTSHPDYNTSKRYCFKECNFACQAKNGELGNLFPGVPVNSGEYKQISFYGNDHAIEFGGTNYDVCGHQNEFEYCPQMIDGPLNLQNENRNVYVAAHTDFVGGAEPNVRYVVGKATNNGNFVDNITSTNSTWSYIVGPGQLSDSISGIEYTFVTYPTETKPSHTPQTNYTFSGYYSAQTGGTPLIPAANNLTRPNAASVINDGDWAGATHSASNIVKVYAQDTGPGTLNIIYNLNDSTGTATKSGTCPNSFEYNDAGVPPVDISDCTVTNRPHSQFLGWCRHDDFVENRQGCNRISEFSSDITTDVILDAIYECEPPYHYDENAPWMACVACGDGDYWNGTDEHCDPCSNLNTTVGGDWTSKAPYTWSEDQCYRTCPSGVACLNATTDMLINGSGCAEKFYNGNIQNENIQIEFYGNYRDNINTCGGDVTYCPYGVLGGSNVCQIKTAAVGVDFHEGNGDAIDTLYIIGELGETNNGTKLDVTTGHAWSQIMGPGQTESSTHIPADPNASSFSFEYAFLYYPVSPAPAAADMSPNTFSGYFAQQSGGTALVGADRELNNTNAGTVIDGTQNISGGNLDNNRDLYAQYTAPSEFTITYNLHNGTYVNSPTLDCPSSFILEDLPIDVTNCVVEREYAHFLGWCLNEISDNCQPIQEIPTTINNNVVLHAKFECEFPRHPSPAQPFDACVACSNGQYWDGQACHSCNDDINGITNTGYTWTSSQPYNWSIRQCYRECNTNCILVTGEMGERFPNNSGKQLSFYGNEYATRFGADFPEYTNYNACQHSNDEVPYCPYIALVSNAAYAVKPMSAPIEFNSGNPLHPTDTRYVIGMRGGDNTVNFGTANANSSTWSFIAGPGQQSDPMYINNSRYTYTSIYYPTRDVPPAEEIEGKQAIGYYGNENGTGAQLISLGNGSTLSGSNAAAVINYDSTNNPMQSNVGRDVYAQYTDLGTCTYTYVCGGGTGPGSIVTIYDSDVHAVLSANGICEYTGFAFDSWLGSDGNTYNPSNPITCDGSTNITLTAQWKAKCLAVNFDDTTNGGTSANNPTRYKLANDTKWFTNDTCTTEWATPIVTQPTHPDNLVFNGYWTTSSGGTVVFSSDGTLATLSWTITENTTLYALYSAPEAPCTLVKFNDGAHGSGGQDQAYWAEHIWYPNDPYAMCKNPDTLASVTPPQQLDAHYAFTGYYTDENCDENSVQIFDHQGIPTNENDNWQPSGDQPTLYACYEQKCITVSFDNVTNGGNGANGEDKLFRVPGANGKWYSTEDNCKNDTESIDSATAASATYTCWDFTGYYTESSDGTELFHSDGSLDTTNNTSWGPEENTTLYAQFNKPGCVEISFNDGNGTGGQGSIGNFYMKAGDSVHWYMNSSACETNQAYNGTPRPIPPTINDQSLVFDGYYTGQNGTGTQIFDGHSDYVNQLEAYCDTTLYAHYITPNTYHITYKMRGGEWPSDSSCPGEDCPSTYIPGVGASVTAQPIRANSEFLGWCKLDVQSQGNGDGMGTLNCADTPLLNYTIGTDETGPVVLLANWGCLPMYHQSQTSYSDNGQPPESYYMCESCDDNQYWDPDSNDCKLCSSGTSSAYPYSVAPYNWSIEQCFRECNKACLDAPSDGSHFPTGGSAFIIDKIVHDTNTNKMPAFYGNRNSYWPNNSQNGTMYDVCESDLVQYCPYGVRYLSCSTGQCPDLAAKSFMFNEDNTELGKINIVGMAEHDSGVYNISSGGNAKFWSHYGPAQSFSSQVKDMVRIMYPVKYAPVPTNTTYLAGYGTSTTDSSANIPYASGELELNSANATSILSETNDYSAYTETDRNLYAIYNEPDEYTITFHLHGGQVAVDGQTFEDVYVAHVNPGDNYTVNLNPTRNDENGALWSQFVSWCNSDYNSANSCPAENGWSEAVCQSESFTIYNVTQNMDFYARWDCINNSHPAPNDPANVCTMCKDNQYWDAEQCVCGACDANDSEFPYSMYGFNWSAAQCFGECGNVSGESARSCTQPTGNNFPVASGVQFVPFKINNTVISKQIKFKGNTAAENARACDVNGPANYCAVGTRLDEEAVYMPRSRPVTFHYDIVNNQADDYYIIGDGTLSSGGQSITMNPNSPHYWGVIDGDAQHDGSDDFGYVLIGYPTDTAPDAVLHDGYLLTGYYNQQNGGDLYINAERNLTVANAGYVLGAGNYSATNDLWPHEGADTYHITYELHGGDYTQETYTNVGAYCPSEFTVEDLPVNVGNCVAERNGARFLGWCLNEINEGCQPITEIPVGTTRDVTLHAKFECEFPLHPDPTNPFDACVSCPNGQYWNGEACHSCSDDISEHGEWTSAAPYNWSIRQCYRRCNSTCTTASGVMGERFPDDSGKQLSFYGNEYADRFMNDFPNYNNYNACENENELPYCPYGVFSPNATYAVKPMSAAVKFYSDEPLRYSGDTRYVIGMRGGEDTVNFGTADANSSAWSFIAGPGQQSDPMSFNGLRYTYTSIYYPTLDVPPAITIEGKQAVAYYGDRNFTEPHLISLINNPTLSGSNAAAVINYNAIASNDSRDVYAKYTDLGMCNYEYICAPGIGSDTGHAYENAYHTIFDSMCTRNDYTFNGWKWSEDSLIYAPNASVLCSPVSNSTFTAQWCQNCWDDDITGTCTLDASVVGQCDYTVQCNDGYILVEHGPNALPTCEPCQDGTYWDNGQCLGCPLDFNLSRSGYNWSIDQCYKYCDNNCINASADMLPSSGTEKFANSPRQISFRGNHNAGINTCNANTFGEEGNGYCPYVYTLDNHMSSGTFATTVTFMGGVDELSAKGTKYTTCDPKSSTANQSSCADTWNIIMGDAQKRVAVPLILYPTHIAPDASVNGYVFDGYFTDRTDGRRVVESDRTLNSDNAYGLGNENGTILYAHYNPGEYHINYEWHGGAPASVNSNSACPTTFTITELPVDVSNCHAERTHSQFVGWCMGDSVTNCTRIPEIPMGTDHDVTLHAIYECVEPWPIENLEFERCEPCADSLYWNSETQSCEYCPDDFKNSVAPYNWSIRQCFRVCDNVTCNQKSDEMGQLFPFYTGNNNLKQISFYGNEYATRFNNQFSGYDDYDACTRSDEVPYCPYVVSEDLLWESISAAVEFNSGNPLGATATRYVIGMRNGDATNFDHANGDRSAWSYIAGPGQQSDPTTINGVSFTNTRIYYPTRNVPPATPVPGYVANGYYGTQSGGDMLVSLGTGSELNSGNAARVINYNYHGLNANGTRDIYAHYKQDKYSFDYSCGDGDGTAPAGQQGVQFGTNYIVAANNTNNPCYKIGYLFNGWKLKVNDSIVPNVAYDEGEAFDWDGQPVPNDNKYHFIANYDFVDYQITYEPGDGADGQTKIQNGLHYQQSFRTYNWSNVEFTKPESILTKWELDDNQSFDLDQQYQYDYTNDITVHGKWNSCTCDQSAQGVSECEISVVHNSCDFNVICESGYTNGRCEPYTDTYCEAKCDWDSTQAKLRLHLNGGTYNGVTPGSESYYEESYDYGQPLVVTPDVPTREHSNFDLWCRNNNLTDDCQHQHNIQNPAGIQEFWAKWSCNDGYEPMGDSCTPKSYSVNYSCGSGNGTPPNSTSVEFDTNFTAANNTCTKRGYRFTGWKVSNTSDIKQPGEPFTWLYTENKTFTAQWEKKEYNVQYSCGCDDCGTVPGIYTATYDEDFVTASDTGCRRPGHEFTHWRLEGTQDTYDKNEVFLWQYDGQSSYTFVAEWQLALYNVTYTPGTGEGTSATQQVRYSDTFTTFTSNDIDFDKPGYQITSWNNIENPGWYSRLGYQYQYYTDGDTTLSAVWEPCPDGTYSDYGACEPCPDGQTSLSGSTIDQCFDKEISCEMPDATSAIRTWDETLREYGKCTIVACVDGYHLSGNACVHDGGVVQIDNGYIIREWNEATSDLEDTIVCNPGWQENAAGTGCEECDNRRVDGDIAASTYATGCEIAACMYQGQKYALRDNECVPICDSAADETGAMHWDENRKKCVRECNPGYKMW